MTPEQKKARAEYMKKYRATHKASTNALVKQSKKRRNDDYKYALKFLGILKADYPDIFTEIKGKMNEAGEERDIDIMDEARDEPSNVVDEVDEAPCYTEDELLSKKVNDLIEICKAMNIRSGKAKKSILVGRILEAQICGDE
jgi:hypothetical protein